MKKYQRIVAMVLTLVIASVVIVSAAWNQSNPSYYLLVVAGPMTGDNAACGIQMKNAAALAVAEINKTGGAINGKQFKTVVYDDQANPNQAAIVAQKIVSDEKIFMVLGHNNSSCSLAAVPFYQKAGLVEVSPTNTFADLTKMGYKNYFRIITIDDVLVQQMVKLACIELGLLEGVALWENDDYGKGMLDAAQAMLPKLGGKLLAAEAYAVNVDRDYSAHITKFKSLGAKVVYFLGEYTGASLFMKQAASLGYKPRVIMSSGCSNSKLIEIGGKDVEGAYILSSFSPANPDPIVQEFCAKYQRKFKTLPGEWGAHTYDIVYMVKAAIAVGGKTKSTLRDALMKLRGFKGVTGVMEFDEFGDVSGKKLFVDVIKDGQFTGYIPSKY